MKICIILKISVNIADFSCVFFGSRLCLISSPKCIESSFKQYGNIKKISHGKLCMKSCYNSKLFENISDFSCMTFCAKKLFQCPQFTYYWIGLKKHVHLMKYYGEDSDIGLFLQLMLNILNNYSRHWYSIFTDRKKNKNVRNLRNRK